MNVVNINDKKRTNTDIAKYVLEFLNEMTGRHYRPTTINLKLILARLKEGYTERVMVAVVSNKVREWKGTDMEMYLRPMTLFNGEKFNNYAGLIDEED